MADRISQEMLESLFSQRHIHEILHQSIEKAMEGELIYWALRSYTRIGAYLQGSYYESKNIRIAELQERIDNTDLHRIIVAVLAAVIRGRRDQTLQQCIGYLQAYMPHEDHFDRARTAGELIALCGGPDRLFEITRRESEDAPVVQVNHWYLIERLFIDQFKWIDDTFFNPPLVKPPKKVKNRYSCGYHTFNEPVILGKLTQHNHQLDFETLNILNEIPWLLDPDVILKGEQPPSELTDHQEIVNFAKHTEQSYRIYGMIGQEPLWLVWQYDSRGRIYSHGYHVNFQSYTHKKMMLNFNHFEVPT